MRRGPYSLNGGARVTTVCPLSCRVRISPRPGERVPSTAHASCGPGACFLAQASSIAQPRGSAGTVILAICRKAIQQASGMSVSVGVDADDGIGGVCEHGHAGCSLHPSAVSNGTGLEGTTRRHICDESRARRGQASDQASR